jgi:RIP metalloprotease RseP
MIITILAFVLTLGVLIVIHEYGHYRVAVACGVKVLRFSVGFGKVIWRRQATPNSTEFVISALPLGGYVRMLDEREGPVKPHELSSAFNRKPLWQRTAVVAAGPVLAADDAGLGLGRDERWRIPDGREWKRWRHAEVVAGGGILDITTAF